MSVGCLQGAKLAAESEARTVRKDVKPVVQTALLVGTEIQPADPETSVKAENGAAEAETQADCLNTSH